MLPTPATDGTDPDDVIPYTKREMYAALRPVQKAFLAAQRIWATSGRIPTIGQVQIDADLVEMRVRRVKRLAAAQESPRRVAQRGRESLIACVRALPEEIPGEGPEETVGPLPDPPSLPD